MYKTHQPIISNHCRACPDNMARALQFCTLTIQESLHRVPDNFPLAEEGDSGVLFGWKYAAYNEAWEYRDHIYKELEEIWSTRRGDDDATERLLHYVASLPGFGLAKAGFLAQLVYGVGGCLDSHNLRRLGLNERKFAGYKSLKSFDGRRAKINSYIDTIANMGSTEYLWDSWCEHVHALTPSRYDSAEHVSRLHVDAILSMS